MTNIVQINTPNQGVIDYLEEALDMAKSGEMQSVVIMGGLSEKRTFTAFETRDIDEQLAMLTFALHRLCAVKGQLVE